MTSCNLVPSIGQVRNGFSAAALSLKIRRHTPQHKLHEHGTCPVLRALFSGMFLGHQPTSRCSYVILGHFCGPWQSLSPSRQKCPSPLRMIAMLCGKADKHKNAIKVQLPCSTELESKVCMRLCLCAIQRSWQLLAAITTCN